MRKALVYATCLVALLCMSVTARAFEIGARGYYWFPELNGDLRVDDKGITGTSIDLETDLNMDKESYPVVEVFAGIGSHHLSLSYYQADYSGTKTISESIVFAGETFNVNDEVTSSLEYEVYDLMYQYDLLDLENILAGCSLGIVGKIKTIDGEAELKSTAITKSVSFTAPIPMVGLGFHMGILADLLEARVLATGIGYSDAAIFDVLADISYTPFPFLDIHGGYRAFLIDAEVEDVEFNFDTSGPYVALTASF